MISQAGAYLGNIKEYTLVDGGAAGGGPHMDVRGRKPIKWGPGDEAAMYKKTVVDHFTELK